MYIIKSKDNEIALRPMLEDDTNNIVTWRNNPRVRNNFIWQKTLTESIHLNWIKSMISTGKAVQFIIVNLNRGGVMEDIGSVYFSDIDYEHHKAEYGIFIGVDKAVGCGYGTIACKLMCQYGFETLKLHKIFLRVFTNNLRAIRSYEKAGFNHEGLLRDDVCIDGTYRDIALMSLINTEILSK